MKYFSELREAVLNGDSRTAQAKTQTMLAKSVDPMHIVLQCLVPAMDEVGRRFACQEYFVPEMLLSARAMKVAMELIRPLLVKGGAEPAGRVVIGTVKGDLHDIGKNLVASMLEGGGFEVCDLGADVAPERFVQAVKEKNADIVCLSALLTVTMQGMKTTIETLSQAGLRGRVKVLVGGAPITRKYAETIGADGYAENASLAVPLARGLMAAGHTA